MNVRPPVAPFHENGVPKYSSSLTVYFFTSPLAGFACTELNSLSSKAFDNFMRVSLKVLPAFFRRRVFFRCSHLFFGKPTSPLFARSVARTSESASPLSAEYLLGFLWFVMGTPLSLETQRYQEKFQRSKSFFQLVLISISVLGF